MDGQVQPGEQNYYHILKNITVSCPYAQQT